MIPADQKQLNIAFPTLTMSLSRGEIQNTVWNHLYSVAAEINSCTAAGASSASDQSTGHGCKDQLNACWWFWRRLLY